MLFTDYTNFELKIFYTLKTYFEKLPPIASDDYENGFYDLIAQFGAGGEEYLLVGSMYVELIETRILIIYEKLSNTDKKEIQVFYERNFLNNYYDADTEYYIYDNDDLVSEMSARFKSWIYDNFSLDELLYDEENEDEENEYDKIKFDGEGENYYDYFIQKVRLEQNKFNTESHPSEYDFSKEFPAYFETFDCLIPEKGWDINCYYFYESHGGHPVIYAKRTDENIDELLSKIDNGIYRYDNRIFMYCESVIPTDHIQLTNLQKGLFQLLILELIGADFARFWHAFYGAVTLISTKSQLAKLLGRDKFKEEANALIEDIDEIIEVDEYDDTICYKLLSFNAWRGIERITYSVSKNFPHKIIVENKEVLAKYHCGITF